ncbi:Secreted protein [Pseudomonas donghuensis]
MVTMAVAKPPLAMLASVKGGQLSATRRSVAACAVVLASSSIPSKAKTRSNGRMLKSFSEPLVRAVDFNCLRMFSAYQPLQVTQRSSTRAETNDIK